MNPWLRNPTQLNEESRMSKKLLGSLSLLVVPAILLAGCAGGTGTPGTKSSDENVTITWMQWWANEQGWEKLDSIKEAFEAAHPTITLEIEDVPSGQAHDKIATLALANQAPDVISMQGAWLTEFASAGIIAPLDDFMADSKVADEILPSLLPNFRGSYWAFPTSFSAVGMYYNKALLSEAGVEVPATWDEYREAASAVTAETGAYGTTANMGAEPPAPISYEIFPFIASAGGEILDEGGNAAFATPEGVEALEFVNDVWNTDGSGTPGAAAANETEKRENFVAGNAAFMFDGPAGVNIIAKGNPDLEYGVAPMPSNAISGTFAVGSVIGVSASSDHKDAAFAFTEWLASEKGSALWAETMEFFPANSKAQQAPFVADSEQLSVFAAIAADSDVVLSVDTVLPNNLELRKLLTNALQGYFAGSLTAADALEQAENEWNTVIEAAR